MHAYRLCLVGLGLAFAGATAAATFTVNSAADNDPGAPVTLRDAIIAANATPGADTIAFDIPAFAAGDGPQALLPVHRIVLATPLPSITDTVTIDGYTQGGAQANTLAQGDNAIIRIEIDGRALTTQADPAGLLVLGAADNSVIRGLSVFGFFHTVNFNLSDGAGLRVNGATGVKLVGNWCGLAADGVTAIPNGTGIDLINTGSAVVGHASAATAAADRNITSGNDVGIRVSGTSASAVDASIKGNLVGPLPSGNALPVFDLPSGATDVKGNRSTGIAVRDVIGTDVGGTSAAEGNVIGGGVLGIALSGASGGSVRSNTIGLGVDGVSALSVGGIGIALNVDADGNLIGGLTGGNTLAFVNNGVQVRFSRGNAVLGNTVRSFVGFDNPTTRRAIDLATASGALDGFSPNDANDVDDGGNRLQNFPVLDEASYDNAGHLDIAGTLDMPAAPASSYVIEVYQTDACGANLDQPQPRQRIAFQNISNSSEHFSFTINTTPTLPFVTVTATAFDAQLDTSEFSPCYPITSEVIFANGFE